MLGQSGGTADREEPGPRAEDFAHATCSRARDPDECQDRTPPPASSQRGSPYIAATSVPRADQKRRRDEKWLITSKPSSDVGHTADALEAEAATMLLNRSADEGCRIPRKVRPRLPCC